MVDWARASGFHVVAAGKGTEYLPAYHDVTPAGVWRHYGLTAGEAQPAGMNPQMFNSFLDGTKSAIEMAAIANATGLDVPTGGLLFPPYGVDDLPHVMRPRDKGGGLEKSGEADLEGVPIPSGSSSIPCQCISQASPIPSGVGHAEDECSQFASFPKKGLIITGLFAPSILTRSRRGHRPIAQLLLPHL
jgi:hypothetical protein